jgi:hypothetical protein
MVLAPCNMGGEGRSWYCDCKYFRISKYVGDVLYIQNIQKWVVKLPGFAIINAWQHFGNRKSASHNK